MPLLHMNRSTVGKLRLSDINFVALVLNRYTALQEKIIL